MPTSRPPIPDEAPPPSGSAKFPGNSDFAAIQNRVGLAISRQSGFLANIRAGRASATGAAATTGAPTRKGAGAFSSASGSAAAASARQQPQSRQPRGRTGGAAAAAADDDDDNLAEYANPNAGIGFVREGREANVAAQGKEDRELKARLLGKRDPGARGKAEKRRVREESVSEEEEGRSGLGRRKRKKAIAAEDVRVWSGAHGVARRDVSSPGGHEGGVEDEDAGMVDSRGVELGVVTGEDREGCDSSKKRRKKTKKKRKDKSTVSQ